MGHVGSRQKKLNDFQAHGKAAVGNLWPLKTSSTLLTSDASTGASQWFPDKQRSGSFASPLLAFNPTTGLLNTGPRVSISQAMQRTGKTSALFLPKRPALNNKYPSMKMPSQSRSDMEFRASGIPGVALAGRSPFLMQQKGTGGHNSRVFKMMGTAAASGNEFPTETLSRFDTNLIAKSAVDQRVTPASRPLEQYMRLPVTGYTLLPMRPGSSLRRIDGSTDLFELEAPVLRFFTVEVQPIVVARVSAMPNSVMISSQKCVIRGSPMVNKLNLNSRFVMDAQIQFTWSNDTIYSKSEITVDVDLQRIFNVLPKRLVVATGSKVVQQAAKLIQRDFLKSLAADFERWSQDDEYFAQRQEMLI